MSLSPPDNPLPPDPFEGRELEGRFRVGKKLGEGGMGLVYRGVQLSVERDVAIKFLHPAMSIDPEAVERFMREAKLVSKLRHPNATMVLDFGRTREGVLWIAMELLRGRPLSRVIAAEGGLRPARVGRILAQICDALAEAHALGVVHRDLKPDNLFLLEGEGLHDTLKVLDFGVARVLGGEAKLTAQGAMVGTPYYMSPEQILGKDVDARSDIYALGIIAFELLTGRLPFRGSSATAILVKHLNDPCPAPSSLVSGLDPKYDVFVHRLVTKEPERRPTTIADVREIVEETFASTTSGLLLVPRAITTPGTTVSDASLPTGLNQGAGTLFGSSRSGWPLWAGIGAAVAAGLVIGLWPSAPPTPPEPVRPAEVAPPVTKPGPSPATAPTPGTPLPPPITPPPVATPAVEKTAAKILVSSRPAGASVFVGDRLLGTTPQDVELEGDPATTAIRVQLEGHQEETRMASTAADGKLHVELVAKPTEPKPKLVKPPKEPGSRADKAGLER